MNYYRHYLGDYQRDTAHLSLIEHGAYRSLLDAYYANDGPIPAEERALFRLTRAMDEDERQAVRRVVAEFFTATNDGQLRHTRCDEELALGLAAIETARENGRKGGRPHKENPEKTQRDTQRDTQRGTQRGTHTKPSGVPTGKALQPPTPNHQPPPTKRQPPPAAEHGAAPLDHRFPNPDHRTAYRALRGVAAVPAAFDALLTATTQSDGTTAYTWEVVGRAVFDLYATNGLQRVSGNALRSFCRSAALPAPAKGNGRADDPASWDMAAIVAEAERLDSLNNGAH